MENTSFEILKCSNEECGLRFPVFGGRKILCPLCKSTTLVVYEGNANSPNAGEPNSRPLPRLIALLDNIRSVFNVGSILRAADGAGLEHIHFCGFTARPDHPRILKTALGAEHSTPWSGHNDAFQTAARLKNKGARLLALESKPDSISLFDLPPLAIDIPHVLIVGNELSGVDPAILVIADQIAHLPMLGRKGSLNAAVAFGIAVYYIRFGSFTNEYFQNTFQPAAA